MYEANHGHYIGAALGTKLDNRFPLSEPAAEQEQEPEEEVVIDALSKNSLLTQILPDPGYFAAGGIAGVISRTATGTYIYMISRCSPNPNVSWALVPAL